MKPIFIFLMLLSFVQSVYAVPTVAGRCEVSALETVYVGKGLIYGAKADSVGDERMGDLFAKFDYVCKAWANKSYMRFETYNLNNSYGSGEAYVTNTWGLVAQTTLLRETISGQYNNVVLHRIRENEVDNDGLIRGTVNVRMFQLDKNGAIGTWSNASNRFSAGTTRTVNLNKTFYIRFSDGNGKYRNIYTTNLPVDIYVYDSTCSIDYNNTIDIGNIYSGRIFSRPFDITLSCNDSVTVQSNVITNFTNGSSRYVSVDNNNQTLNYNGDDGVLVNMSIRSENGENIVFGEDYDLSVIDISGQSSYTVKYVGDFEALSKSNQGDFSFIVNFELTYN